MTGKKKKAKKAQIVEKMAGKALQRTKPTRKKLIATAEERRAKKLELRRLEKKAITAEMWAAPAPSNLVGKLAVPRITSRYKTYFEIADNHEKKKKKLEYKVTNDPNPPPGFAFVPIGDPDVTNKCKELSRERDVMIFVVSDHKEENSRISEHVYRTGYHFRESIVEEVRQIIGETVISAALVPLGFIEPIPEDQEEINKQADKALRDLFPRIPNTDRQMIIDHAFKKGAMFAGEPTVGLQANIPLSRRVQLATLAHIRHTHTRYDQLLRETSWMNARKVVEPVCLDVLLKWRGDEETGRDQMDEILREVVVITDSEEDEDTSDEEDTSEDEGEITSSSSSASVGVPSRNHSRMELVPADSIQANDAVQPIKDQDKIPPAAPASGSRSAIAVQDKRAQRGFQRYRNALADAVKRRNLQDAADKQMEQRNLAHMPNATTEASYHMHDGQSSLVASYEPTPSINYTSSQASTFDDRPQRVTDYLPSRTTGIPPRSEADVRPVSHSTAYSQRLLPRSIDPLRPPQVVRENGLQDLLVPSIEAGTGSFSSPSYSSSRHLQPFEHRQHGSTSRPHFDDPRSPPRHEIIVLDDDSPKVKRPRFYQEPNLGHFQHNDSVSRVKAERVDDSMHGRGYSTPTSSSRRTEALHTSQYMSRFPRDDREFAEEQLPVYDAPASGAFSQHPRQLGISEVEYRPAARHDDQGGYIRDNVRDYARAGAPNSSHTHTRQIHPAEGARQTDRPVPHLQMQVHDHPKYTVPNSGPAYNVERAHPVASRSSTVDHDFVQSFSQSRLGAHPVQRSDGVIVLSESAHTSHPSQRRFVQQYDDRYSQGQRGSRYDQPLDYASREGDQSRAVYDAERREPVQLRQSSHPPRQPEYIILD